MQLNSIGSDHSDVPQALYRPYSSLIELSLNMGPGRPLREKDVPLEPDVSLLVAGQRQLHMHLTPSPLSIFKCFKRVIPSKSCQTLVLGH